MTALLEKWPISKNGQFKMADNERRKGRINLIMGSTPTNEAIVLLLSYIMTSLLKKWPNSKNGQLWPFMANYEITEGRINLILGSTPTN